MSKIDNIKLNVPLLKKRVPNLTSAARSVGLRPATVSNLCTGKIPVGRSEVRTLVALATLAKCSLDELVIRNEPITVLETKIKAVDLFAPIAKGGTIGLIARPGMGQLVLLGEMLHRFKEDNYVSILFKPKGQYPELADLLKDVDHITNSIEETYHLICELATNNNEIILATDREHVISGEIFDLQNRIQLQNVEDVTTFLVDLKGQVVDEELPYGPLETLLYFDADLAARNLFPAINPIYSTSSVLEGNHLDEFHFSIQLHARKLLRRFRELRSLVSVRGMESLPSSELEIYRRGERLEAYLTQPFIIAEDYTGRTGESVRLVDAINDVQTILSGGLDAERIENLIYIGSL